MFYLTLTGWPNYVILVSVNLVTKYRRISQVLLNYRQHMLVLPLCTTRSHVIERKIKYRNKSFCLRPIQNGLLGLGMLLFCLVYGGVPFQQSSPNDHAFAITSLVIRDFAPIIILLNLIKGILEVLVVNSNWLLNLRIMVLPELLEIM